MVISDVFTFRREYNAMKPMIDNAINKPITDTTSSIDKKMTTIALPTLSVQ
jgi:hypothetical protein